MLRLESYFLVVIAVICLAGINTGCIKRKSQQTQTSEDKNQASTTGTIWPPDE